MVEKTGKFTLTVPSTHAQAGQKITKPFGYRVCQTEEEAQAIAVEKKFSFLKLVNAFIKDTARSNAYQAALLPYKPVEVSQDDIKERMVRDMIRSGFTEEKARVKVEANLAELAAEMLAEAEAAAAVEGSATVEGEEVEIDEEEETETA